MCERKVAVKQTQLRSQCRQFGDDLEKKLVADGLTNIAELRLKELDLNHDAGSVRGLRPLSGVAH